MWVNRDSLYLLVSSAGRYYALDLQDTVMNAKRSKDRHKKYLVRLGHTTWLNLGTKQTWLDLGTKSIWLGLGT